MPSDGRKEVFFELDASSAKEVLLAGDFTGWEKTPIKLRKGERGDWHATVKLGPGQYHYKFVVDGQWQDDPRATASCPNPFGTCDSVLEIS
jgi:1,4-alpha-glucan branching enzyme